jgi:hypothetical protein
VLYLQEFLASKQREKIFSKLSNTGTFSPKIINIFLQ